LTDSIPDNIFATFLMDLMFGPFVFENTTLMKIVHKLEAGEINITEDTQINAVKAKKVLIAPNVTARVFGIVTEEIILEEGSKVYLHGTLLGRVINNGGEIIIHPERGNTNFSY
jgi:hypothetical protein